MNHNRSKWSRWMALMAPLLLAGGLSGWAGAVVETMMGRTNGALSALGMAAAVLVPLEMGLVAGGWLFWRFGIGGGSARQLWRALVSRDNTDTFGGPMIAVTSITLILFWGYYRFSLLAMTRFHHMGLAALLLSVVLIGLLFLTVVVGRLITIGVGRFWGIWRARRVPLPRLVWVLVICLCMVTLLLGVGTMGSGDQGLGPFGFLRLLGRDGVMLGPVVGVMGMTVFGGALVVVLERVDDRVVVRVLAGVLLVTAGLVPLASTQGTSRLSSAGGVSGPLVTVVHRLLDRDKDGFSAAFGGGDCDDGNPKVYPGAVEVPDNGIDEDCDGADLRLAALKKQLGKTEAPTPEKPLSKPVFPQGLNVVLITVDALRADGLGLLGNPNNATPNLDRFFGAGTVYENAYSMSSYTSQSIPAIMTGKYPSELHRSFAQKTRIGLDETFVAEQVCQTGRHCQAFLSHFLFRPFYGWNQGFERWDVVDGVPKDALSTAEMTTSEDLTTQVLRWLSNRENTAKPYFLWMHYMDPHGNYLMHKGVKTFGNGRRARYDHEILFTDFHLGRVIEQFKTLPTFENTIFILTADHGESFGEHGRFLHGYELYEENLRVPLAVVGPMVAQKRIARPTSQIDLYATLLDLMGGTPARNTHGRSLLPDWVDGQMLPEGPIFADQAKNDKYEQRRVLISNGWKLHQLQDGSFRLFNLKDDPKEQRNRVADAPEQFSRMKAALQVFVATQLHPKKSVDYLTGPLKQMP